ncbi:hypothetical protein [Polaromonas sp. CG9_12]|nr:hypothetical protein [Polaromonas sp. CG9_12]
MADKKTLADALAEIEASNAKAAELRAKQAPELIAEAVERTALNARLAALPQKQRRQVLDAAGLNHVSAAPPPITPVSGRSAAQPPKPAAPLSIDWHFWCNMQTVKLWQACALTVGLDPDRLRPHPQAWMAGPGSGPVFDGKSFPSQEIEAKFEKALRLAENAVSYMNGPIFPKGTPHHGSNKEKTVLLSEVATFFISCAWPDIPDTLQTLARPSPPAMAPKATPEHQAAPLEAVPVVEVQKSEPIQTTAGPKFSMSKAGLIEAHRHEWQTIERDLKDASENGLSVAKAGPRDWNEAMALQWARAKGKLTITAKPVNDLANAFHSMSNLPSHRHTLKG